MNGRVSVSKVRKLAMHVDPLVRSDAIVVLGGGTPAREIAAANLYADGRAPLVLMARSANRPGRDVIRERRSVLVEHGVPAKAVAVAGDDIAQSTMDEARLVAAWATAHEIRRLIVVTSSYHTARSRFAFERALHGSGVEIRMAAASRPPFDPAD